MKRAETPSSSNAEPRQADLPGFDPPPPVKAKARAAIKPPREGRDRLLFALVPPSAVADTLAQLALDQRIEQGLHGKPLRTQHFHVTLCHLGDFNGVPGDVVERASHVAASMRSTSFDVLFDYVMSFGRKTDKPKPNHPFVLRGDTGVAGLVAFRRDLMARLREAGLPTDPGFTPHVTLLYDDRIVAPQPVAPVVWKADEFVLIHSLLGQTKHVHLSRWPLHG